MNKLIILVGAILIATGSILAVSAQTVPDPPMDQGMITITPLDDGTMVMSSMSGNTTVNIEVHPPAEEEETVEIVVFEITAATAVCNSVTNAVSLQHDPENFGRNQADSHIWRSDSDFIDFGEIIETGTHKTDYIILNMSINENMTEFTGHGVVADSIGGICDGRNIPGEDLLFPIIVTGTCGAGTSYTDDDGVISNTPGTFRMEGQSANSHTITSTAPDFYSHCYRE